MFVNLPSGHSAIVARASNLTSRQPSLEARPSMDPRLWTFVILTVAGIVYSIWKTERAKLQAPGERLSNPHNTTERTRLGATEAYQEAFSISYDPLARRSKRSLRA